MSILESLNNWNKKLIIALSVVALLVIPISVSGCNVINDAVSKVYGTNYITLESHNMRSGGVSLNPPGEKYIVSATYYNTAPVAIKFSVTLKIYNKSNVVVKTENKILNLASNSRETIEFNYQSILFSSTNPEPTKYNLSISSI